MDSLVPIVLYIAIVFTVYVGFRFARFVLPYFKGKNRQSKDRR